MTIEYSQPTLFGVAYASRLFRETDVPSSYDHLVNETKPMLNLGNESHVSEQLKWLNKWNCRIAKDSFGKLSLQLKKWFAEQGQKLPPVGIDIVGLEDSGLNQLMAAYEALRKCGLGPAAAAKTLFAVRPRCAIPWDGPIRAEFKLQDNGSGYRAMLQRSCEEANNLVMDAKRYEIHTEVDILNAVGSAAHNSLAKLLDEYHWITITGGYKIPGLDELERWTSWNPGGTVQ